MRKMIMVIGLSLLLVVPTHMDAKEVYFRHGSKDSWKARTVLPQVTGDLEAEELTLDIYRYAGIAQICISDDNGNMVQTYSEVIQGKNTMHLLFGDLSRGLYTIVVTLGSNIYLGIVDII